MTSSISSKEYKASGRKAGKMPARRAAKRDASEREIVSTLEQCGFSVVRLDTPVDLLVGFRGRCWLVECKSGTTGYGKDLNQNQKDFDAARRGPRVVILRSAQDASDWAVEVSALEGDRRKQSAEEFTSIGDASARVIDGLRQRREAAPR